jgi:Chaperone of endosialidase
MKPTSRSEIVQLYQPIPPLTTIVPRRNPINHSLFRDGVFLIALAWFAVSPITQAVIPPPDGGYPGGNTAEGQAALLSLTTGGYNTALGFLSLRSNTTGAFNTAIGAGTLLLNTANENTATGAAALLSNTTGSANTAHGGFALFSNTLGSFNTAVGDGTLFSNTTGYYNTASGMDARSSNATGHDNTATGASALANNTTGQQNTAAGSQALFSNTTGHNNVANGFQALSSNTESANTAIGAFALFNNTTGAGNTAVGDSALFNNTTGVGNVALGSGAGVNVTTASNVIAIGATGADVSNTTWIANIYGTTTMSGANLPVLVSDTGQLGTEFSSRRFKKEIKPMDQASEAILSLKPVTFHYKSDKANTPQFGLIAEEVAEVTPDLVVRDKEGKIYTVRYDQINAMLLNEFLKEHRIVQALKKDFQATVAQQQKKIQALTARLEEQASQIQKVSAQLELRNPPATTIVTDE